MARQIIINTPQDSGLGDSLFVAFNKVNAMTLELYNQDASFSGELETISAIVDTINDGVSTLNHKHTLDQIIGLQVALSGKVSTTTFNTQIAAINASIVQINSTISDIIDELQTKVDEAPFSGITYGRNNGQWVEISGGTTDLSNYVPYTGGTKNLILTANSITADSFSIPTTSTGGANIGTFESGSRVYRMSSTGDYGTRQFELTPDYYRLLLANSDFDRVNEITATQNNYLLYLNGDGYENEISVENTRQLYQIRDNNEGKTNNITLTPEGVETQGYLKFNTAYEITGNEPQGAVYWNSDRETLQLKMNGTNYDYGMSLFFYVKNQTGETFEKGDVIGFGGTLGASGIILGVKYVNDGSQPSDRLMGVCNERIEDGEEGKVVFFGEIRGVDTSSLSDGDILYASNIVAGLLTKNEPAPGTNKGEIAAVVHAASNGVIFVRALTSKRLTEIDDVQVNGPVNGQTLIYDGGIWKNDSNTIYQPYISPIVVTTPTVITSLRIPANWLKDGDTIKIEYIIRKDTVTTNNVNYSLFQGASVNSTTNAITTIINLTPAQRTNNIVRYLTLNGTNLICNVRVNNSAGIQTTPDSAPLVISGFDRTVDNWISLQVNPVAPDAPAAYINYMLIEKYT